jgi:hypothetical protein
MKNIAFIDGQNLYKSLERHIDLQKFRIFLEKRFDVKEAYYFLGFKEKENDLYILNFKNPDFY